MNNENTFDAWWAERANDFSGCTGIMQEAFRTLAEQGWDAGRIALLKQWEIDSGKTLSGCDEE